MCNFAMIPCADSILFPLSPLPPVVKWLIYRAKGDGRGVAEVADYDGDNRSQDEVVIRQRGQSADGIMKVS